nr:DNA (cytosine-5-)-methyltransferase [Hyphomonas sp. Mor2]
MRTLDLFCGGGGSSFGARAAGAQIVGGVDLWGLATQTFKHNFPDATVKTSRLEDIDPEALREEIGPIELLLASPECTNHTCAKGAAPRSEESRATALQAIRYAKVFDPDWVVMENVVHMRPWSRYEEMKRELRDLGYSINELVLDAAYFSVPQSRRRLFLVCGKNRAVKMKVPNRKTTKTVQTVLDKPGTWKTSQLYSEKRAPATLERAERAFSEVGKNQPFLIVYYGTDGSGGWQPLDRPLRTITTVDRFALVEPVDGGHTMRMLQVPELARAMGFTKRYEMPFGTRRQRVHMLGNGVCPPVMKWVVKCIMDSSIETVQSCPGERPEPEYQTPLDPTTDPAAALVA